MSCGEQLVQWPWHVLRDAGRRHPVILGSASRLGHQNLCNRSDAVAAQPRHGRGCTTRWRDAEPPGRAPPRHTAEQSRGRAAIADECMRAQLKLTWIPLAGS